MQAVEETTADVGYRPNGDRSGPLPRILVTGEDRREEHSSIKWVGIKLNVNGRDFKTLSRRLSQYVYMIIDLVFTVRILRPNDPETHRSDENPSEERYTYAEE